MNPTKYFLPFLLTFLALASPLTGQTATEKLQVAITDIQAILKTGSFSDPILRERFKSRVLEFFSAQHISRRSLGRGWAQLDEAQQERFEVLFTDILLQSYAEQLAKGADAEVLFESERLLGNPKQVEVGTVARFKDADVKIQYRLFNDSGNWQVYDVIVEGVSLVSNYRSQFAALLQRGGPDGLLERLESIASERQP